MTDLSELSNLYTNHVTCERSHLTKMTFDLFFFIIVKKLQKSKFGHRFCCFPFLFCFVTMLLFFTSFLIKKCTCVKCDRRKNKDTYFLTQLNMPSHTSNLEYVPGNSFLIGFHYTIMIICYVIVFVGSNQGWNFCLLWSHSMLLFELEV